MQGYENKSHDLWAGSVIDSCVILGRCRELLSFHSSWEPVLFLAILLCVLIFSDIAS